MRVAARGKSFLLDGSPFRFRGIRYAWGASSDAVERDLARIAAAGYTVVVAPPPPAHAVNPARAAAVRFMLDVGPSAGRELFGSVHRWAGSEALLGFSLAASAPRAEELAAIVHDEDAGLLVAWRSPWPLSSECPAEVDFLLLAATVGDPDQLAPSLMHCHCQMGDRPVVVDDPSLAPADVSRAIDTSLRCGAGGTVFGGWSPAHASLVEANRRRVCDLEVDWPSVSVVVNAYNAEDTLDECLWHCDRLEYPGLEVIVVDDGSTDASAEIARAHPRVRLVETPHLGLSEGRNVGYRAASGELIAYLDADAYPAPDWLWYLALAAREEGAGGAGGPNIPPPGEPSSARVVACSPGGPVPRLRSPGRAEHLPGCNMAFWKTVLEQLGGFDTVLEAAEDVELEWRVLDAGLELTYHPAALVWHHRRAGLGRYLGQQRHYGRGQAILEQRCPERFPAGYRIRSAFARLFRERGGVPSQDVRYLTLPRAESAKLELAHQWGVPAALLVSLSAPVGLLRPRLAAPAAAGVAYLATLFAIDAARAGTGRRRAERTRAFRASVAAFRILRPLAFRWGHLSGRRELRRGPRAWPPHHRGESAPRTVVR